MVEGVLRNYYAGKWGEALVPDRNRMILSTYHVLAIICVAALTSILSACGSKTNTIKNMELTALIAEAEKKAYLVNQFRTEFIKTRRNSVFNRDMKVKGILVFQKPDKFQLSISGDANVDVLSNGRIVTVTHDQKDQEVYRVHGERDLSKMADPLMLLMESMGNGGLRRFTVIKSVQMGNTLITEVDPSNYSAFARVKKATLSIDDSGQLTKVSIDFKNGDVDEIEFKSWTLLAQNDPEIISLNDKLSRIADQASINEPRTDISGLDVVSASVAEASRNGTRLID